MAVAWSITPIRNAGKRLRPRVGNSETSIPFESTIDLAHGIIHGTTTANSHGGGTITAAGISVGRTLLKVPDSVFDDPGYKRLSIPDVMVFVKEHADLPWITGRAELGNIDLGQRLNEVLESVENLWLYIQRFLSTTKSRTQEWTDWKKKIRS